MQSLTLQKCKENREIITYLLLNILLKVFSRIYFSNSIFLGNFVFGKFGK